MVKETSFSEITRLSGRLLLHMFPLLVTNNFGKSV